MARVWLVLILAFALASGGVANAVAANCPMQAAAAASVHACCPDAGKAAQGQQQKQTSDGCVFGMACRSAAAVAPTIVSVQLPSAVVLISEQRLGQPAPPSGPLQQLFRPPRTI